VNVKSEYEIFKREAQWNLDNGHPMAAHRLCVAADHLATIIQLEDQLRLILEKINELRQLSQPLPTHTLH